MLAGVPTALLNYPSWAIEVSVEQAQVYVFKLSLHWFLVKAAFTDWPIEVFIEQKLLTSTTWKDLDGGTSSASVANPNTRLIFRWVERRLINYRKLLLQGESFPRWGVMHLHEASVCYSVWVEKSLGRRLSYPFKRWISRMPFAILLQVLRQKSSQIHSEGSGSQLHNILKKNSFRIERRNCVFT